MSRLRKAIESDRRDYASARYVGDLGDLVLAEPPRRVSWRRVAAGLAIAATLLLALMPADKEPRPQRPQPVANKTQPKQPAPRLVQAVTQASRVTRPSKLLRQPKLKPLSFVHTEPRVSVTPTTQITKTRRRFLSTPSLALRSMKDVTRFGT